MALLYEQVYEETCVVACNIADDEGGNAGLGVCQQTQNRRTGEAEHRQIIECELQREGCDDEGEGEGCVARIKRQAQ